MRRMATLRRRRNVPAAAAVDKSSPSYRPKEAKPLANNQSWLTPLPASLSNFSPYPIFKKIQLYLTEQPKPKRQATLEALYSAVKSRTCKERFEKRYPLLEKVQRDDSLRVEDAYRGLLMEHKRLLAQLDDVLTPNLYGQLLVLRRAEHASSVDSGPAQSIPRAHEKKGITRSRSHIPCSPLSPKPEYAYDQPLLPLDEVQVGMWRMMSTMKYTAAIQFESKSDNREPDDGIRAQLTEILLVVRFPDDTPIRHRLRSICPVTSTIVIGSLLIIVFAFVFHKYFALLSIVVGFAALRIFLQSSPFSPYSGELQIRIAASDICGFRYLNRLTETGMVTIETKRLRLSWKPLRGDGSWKSPMSPRLRRPPSHSSDSGGKRHHRRQFFTPVDRRQARSFSPGSDDDDGDDDDNDDANADDGDDDHGEGASLVPTRANERPLRRGGTARRSCRSLSSPGHTSTASRRGQSVPPRRQQWQGRDQFTRTWPERERQRLPAKTWAAAGGAGEAASMTEESDSSMAEEPEMAGEAASRTDDDEEAGEAASRTEESEIVGEAASMTEESDRLEAETTGGGMSDVADESDAAAAAVGDTAAQEGGARARVEVEGMKQSAVADASSERAAVAVAAAFVVEASAPSLVAAVPASPATTMWRDGTEDRAGGFSGTAEAAAAAASLFPQAMLESDSREAAAEAEAEAAAAAAAALADDPERAMDVSATAEAEAAGMSSLNLAMLPDVYGVVAAVNGTSKVVGLADDADVAAAVDTEGMASMAAEELVDGTEAAAVLAANLVDGTEAAAVLGKVAVTSSAAVELADDAEVAAAELTKAVEAATAVGTEVVTSMVTAGLPDGVEAAAAAVDTERVLSTAVAGLADRPEVVAVAGRGTAASGHEESRAPSAGATGPEQPPAGGGDDDDGDVSTTEVSAEDAPEHTHPSPRLRISLPGIDSWASSPVEGEGTATKCSAAVSDTARVDRARHAPADDDDVRGAGATPSPPPPSGGHCGGQRSGEADRICAVEMDTAARFRRSPVARAQTVAASGTGTGTGTAAVSAPGAADPRAGAGHTGEEPSTTVVSEEGLCARCFRKLWQRQPDERVRVLHDQMVTFKFEEPLLPLLLKNFILENEELIPLCELGLPGWSIFMVSYGIYYKRWMRHIFVLCVWIVSLIMMSIGLYDLFRTFPRVRGTFAWLLGNWFAWFEEAIVFRAVSVLTFLLPQMTIFRELFSVFKAFGRANYEFGVLLLRALRAPYLVAHAFFQMAYAVINPCCFCCKRMKNLGHVAPAAGQTRPLFTAVWVGAKFIWQLFHRIILSGITRIGVAILTHWTSFHRLIVMRYLKTVVTIGVALILLLGYSVWHDA